MTALLVDSLISSSWIFLNSFYKQQPTLNIFDFIQFSQTSSPRVLVDDQSDSENCFLAIEFPETLKQSEENLTTHRTQTLSVICEEVSHFFHLVNAAQRMSRVSLLQLEALGEIDRFVCFLHWNAFFPDLSVLQKIDNCSDAVELLFERRHFEAPQKELYIDAEALAFYHLRRAFSHCWTQRYFDASQFDLRARKYILALAENRSDQLLSA
jgi:hypothetical protein